MMHYFVYDLFDILTSSFVSRLLGLQALILVADNISNLNLRLSASVFPTRSDTNPAVQPQKMARGLKFWKWRDCTIYVVKTKAQISCAVTAQLICAFVFAYAKSRFSHDVAHI